MNERHTVNYTGVTNDLIRRVNEHKTKATDGFTSRYNVDQLVYFEQTEDIQAALNREKAIKGMTKFRKIRLIKSQNPEFKDLYEDIIL
jgi:putative endonuclease